MIGVIADDLTGASEIGAIGLRFGLRAVILAAGRPDAGAGLVCIDTDSRSCNAREARKRAALATRTLRRAGAKWIYKKVDSVLRGNVTPEVESVIKDLRADGGLIVPANPSLGRTIRNGTYYVRGKPLNQTEFARDPDHPRPSARVLDCVTRPKSFTIQLCGVDDALPEFGIAIGEAASKGDLKRWAERGKPEVLMAGGAEFFEALLEASGLGHRQGSRKLPASSAGMRELFVCGTATSSAKQLTQAARARNTPVFALPRELAWGAEFSRAAMEAIARRVAEAFSANRRIVLNIGLPMARHPFITSELTQHLTGVAELVIRQAGVGHVYAEGGATAAALVRRMGWKRFDVLRELAPGVATLAVDGDKTRLLTMKPGSYSWPSSVI